MPVNSTHPEYDAALPVWLRARDVFAGEDAVKAGGEKYLPRLEDQTQAEYDAYRMRASFFNATSRTCEGFLGLVFRRDPPSNLDHYRPNADYKHEQVSKHTHKRVPSADHETPEIR